MIHENSCKKILLSLIFLEFLEVTFYLPVRNPRILCIFATIMKGLVIRTTGSWYKVLELAVGDTVGSVCPQPISLQWEQHTYDCRLRGNYRLRGNKQTNPIAVGDYVQFSLQDDGTGVISEVEDRKNYIIRRATKLSKQTHVIASNIDLLCVVATLGFPRTSTGFIDRLLVTAEAYHIPACIIFNKIDLYGPEGSELWALHNEVKSIYTAAGYPTYEISATQHIGIDSVKKLIAGKIVLFSGHSGVGKSALLNAVAPQLNLKEGEVSDWSLKGKHTTTFAEIHPIEAGTFLIDTPGIKEFGIVDFSAEDLTHFFPEMRSRLHDCQFSNCTHRHEPHCAVKAAVASGEISQERYNNYLNIIQSIEE